MKQRPNVLAGLATAGWLIVIVVPLYVIAASSIASRGHYLQAGPISLPTELTWQNYVDVLSSGFMRYFLNTAVVTVAVVLIVVALVAPLSYAIVRNPRRSVRVMFQLMLVGIAIPSQAVIIPVFFIIQELGLYDSLVGVILPTAAFAVPVSALILTGSMRDITSELYEAMAIDGASTVRVFFSLVVPISRAGLATIAIFAGMQAWNGFHFPLILTRSAETKVLTMGLYEFQSEFGVDTPRLMAAVVISILPMFLAYLFARRSLVQGLMGVGGR